MVDFQKYSEKEVLAAIKAVEEIVNTEEFAIDVVEEDGELLFCLIDYQGVYLGDIGSDRFSSLGGIIDRMDIYHNDYFYTDYEERVDQNEEIPQDDFDRKILIFLESKYCQEVLTNIDVETYQKYKEREFDSLHLNSGETERYVKDGRFDAVGYLCDKSIAIQIMDTQLAYPMIEYDNSIYVAAHGDWYSSKEEMLRDLSAGETSFCNGYTNYGTLIETELYQVKDDMNDVGLYDLDDKYSFYLSEYELEYIGLSDELKEFNKDFASIIADAKVRADSNSDVSRDKKEIEPERE